jgi:hypothetical protein
MFSRKGHAMSVLNKIAYFQNRRDEVPNQELARELAETKNLEGIREIAENLWNKEPNIQSDCLKVLYETGYLTPELIADYADDFLKLLKSRNNRMVWGAMIALAAIASLKADELYPHIEEIKKTMENGSVITVDNGVKVLTAIAASKEEYAQEIFPYLLDHLANCRIQDVARYAETILPAIDSGNKNKFVAILENRMEDMSDAQLARVKKVLKQAAKQ